MSFSTFFLITLCWSGIFWTIEISLQLPFFLFNLHLATCNLISWNLANRSGFHPASGRRCHVTSTVNLAWSCMGEPTKPSFTLWWVIQSDHEAGKLTYSTILTWYAFNQVQVHLESPWVRIQVKPKSFKEKIQVQSKTSPFMTPSCVHLCEISVVDSAMYCT